MPDAYGLTQCLNLDEMAKTKRRCGRGFSFQAIDMLKETAATCATGAEVAALIGLARTVAAEWEDAMVMERHLKEAIARMAID